LNLRRILLENLQDKHDAFYVGDLGDIIRKYRNWITHLPRVEPFYGMIHLSLHISTNASM